MPYDDPAPAPAVAWRRRAAHVFVQVAVAPPIPGAVIRRAAWRGAAVAGRLDVAFLAAAVIVRATKAPTPQKPLAQNASTRTKNHRA